MPISHRSGRKNAKHAEQGHVPALTLDAAQKVDDLHAKATAALTPLVFNHNDIGLARA